MVDREERERVIHDLHLQISDLKDKLESMKIERDVFQKENHRLLSIMLEKGWVTNG